TDRTIRDSVSELNTLGAKVAQLNTRITGGGGIDADALRDERDLAIRRMAELADVSVLHREDGAVDVTVGTGYALVVGASSFAVSLTTQPPDGFAALGLADHDITASVTGGRIGGLLTLRDSTLAGYQGRIDQLAYDIATEVNALHTSGFDATGAAGGVFFTAPGAVAGAAASLSVSAAVAADPQLVAASGTGAVGDNATARAVAGLRESRVMAGGTATASEVWAR